MPLHRIAAPRLACGNRAMKIVDADRMGGRRLSAARVEDRSESGVAALSLPVVIRHIR